MPGLETAPNRRILVIDDNAAIQNDFRKILTQDGDDGLDEMEQQLFGGKKKRVVEAFDLDTASQGMEGLEKATAARNSGRPYAVAFVDMRMPPGWDGLTTIEHLWEVDPELQVVICTAFSDHSWSEVVDRLGSSDQLLIIKKPFDTCEISQVALALTQKWDATRNACLKAHSLERLVKERTAELQAKEDQLRHKQKLEAIGSLAAGIAHEFNNLLQVIRGHASFAMQGLSETELRYEDLQHVLEASDRAASITNQLLDFSRQRPAEKATVSVANIIKATAGMIRPLIGDHIVVTIDCEDDAPCVYVDREILEQAVMNLCINAADAMPQGGRLTISAKLETENQSDDRLTEATLAESLLQVESVDGDDVVVNSRQASSQSRAVITVTDDGCGMSEEVRQRVFDPFYTTKDVGKGTGLGLAFVYGAVTQFDGTITIESKVNQGTTFRIFLPVSDELPEPKRAASAVQVVRGTETILLAEDEPLVRAVATRILESAGYTVMAVENGEQAVQKYETHCDSIDLLLLDAMMPELNGYDAIRQIRTKHPDTKAILCSGYSPKQHSKASSGMESLPLVQKPFEPGVLLGTIRQMLSPSTETLLGESA